MLGDHVFNFKLMIPAVWGHMQADGSGLQFLLAEVLWSLSRCDPRELSQTPKTTWIRIRTRKTKTSWGWAVPSSGQAWTCLALIKLFGYGLKKFWVKKKFGSKRILGQKKFWIKKNLGQKKFLVKKIFRSKENLGLKKNLFWKQFFY